MQHRRAAGRVREDRHASLHAHPIDAPPTPLAQVTVPIKLRAIYAGISTGWLDVRHKHDNSWWESFGAAQAAQWVQMWLLGLFFAMVAALIAGPIHLIIGAFSPEGAPPCARGRLRSLALTRQQAAPSARTL